MKRALSRVLAVAMTVLWGFSGAYAAAPGQPKAQQAPSQRALAPAPRKLGFFKRMRRSRTASPPTIYRLLRLGKSDKQLLKQGRFLYWKIGAQIYRFKTRRFSKEVGPRLRRKASKSHTSPVEFVVLQRKPKKVTLLLKGKKTSLTVLPCRIKMTRKTPRRKPTNFGMKSNPFKLPTFMRKIYTPDAIGLWSSVDLMKNSHSLRKGRLSVRIVKGGSGRRATRRRARSAHFYRVSLPGSVLQAFQAAKKAKKKALKRYVVAFRVVAYKRWRRYPAKHWMPHPHGGFRHYQVTGRPAPTKK